MSEASNIYTYGAITVDLANLPESSRTAMFRRGLSHYFGSEQSSKVTGQFKPDAEGKVKCDLPDTVENRAAMLAEYQAKALDALLAGTVGVSVRGPTLDPIATIVARLAKAEIKTILAKNGVKFPAKAEDTIEMPDGSKVTGAQLVSRRLDPNTPAGVDSKGAYGPVGLAHAERLTKEAKKIADDQAKKAKKAEEAGGISEL